MVGNYSKNGGLAESCGTAYSPFVHLPPMQPPAFIHMRETVPYSLPSAELGVDIHTMLPQLTVSPDTLALKTACPAGRRDSAVPARVIHTALVIIRNWK